MTSAIFLRSCAKSGPKDRTREGTVPRLEFNGMKKIESEVERFERIKLNTYPGLQGWNEPCLGQLEVDAALHLPLWPWLESSVRIPVDVSVSCCTVAKNYTSLH